MNIKQKIQLYDHLYRHADKLIKKHNPCKVKNGKCIDGEFCCNNCEHLTKSGCSVNCLMCKLYLCHRATNHNKKLARTFRRMQTKAYKHDLLHIRYSRETMIKYLQEVENEKKRKK